MSGLKLFTRTSDRHSWNLASYHSPHSLTWSWLLCFSLFRSDVRRVWPLGWAYRTNTGRCWGLRLPWIGVLHYQSQRPIWYRDLYMQQRGERAQPSERESIARTVRRSTPRIVADGGVSLH